MIVHVCNGRIMCHQNFVHLNNNIVIVTMLFQFYHICLHSGRSHSSGKRVDGWRLKTLNAGKLDSNRSSSRVFIYLLFG